MRSDIPISQTPIAGSDDLREELSLLFKFLVAVEEKNPVDRASEAQKLYTKARDAYQELTNLTRITRELHYDVESALIRAIEARHVNPHESDLDQARSWNNFKEGRRYIEGNEDDVNVLNSAAGRVQYRAGLVSGDDTRNFYARSFEGTTATTLYKVFQMLTGVKRGVVKKTDQAYTFIRAENDGSQTRGYMHWQLLSMSTTLGEIVKQTGSDIPKLYFVARGRPHCMAVVGKPPLKGLPLAIHNLLRVDRTIRSWRDIGLVLVPEATPGKDLNKLARDTVRLSPNRGLHWVVDQKNFSALERWTTGQPHLQMQEYSVTNYAICT